MFGVETSKSTITDCKVTLNIVGVTRVGGFMGDVCSGYTNFTRCTFTGSISGATDCGGLIPCAHGTHYFYQCVVNANLTATEWAGGIIAHFMNAVYPNVI